MSDRAQLRQIRALVERSPRQVVLVVGAGVTIGALASSRLRRTRDVARLLDHGLSHVASQKLIDSAEHRALSSRASSGDSEMMVQVADRLIDSGGGSGGAYRAWLEEVFGEFDAVAKRNAVLDQLTALKDLGVRIATTNYDGVLERFLGLEPVLWQDAAAAEAVLGGRRDAVLHLHGHWRTPSSVVLGMGDYGRLLADANSERLLQAGGPYAGDDGVRGDGDGADRPELRSLRSWASEALRGSSNTHYWLVLRGEEHVVTPTELRDRERPSSPTTSSTSFLSPWVSCCQPAWARRRGRSSFVISSFC